ncbi:MAG: GGDEF domain-containing protein [Pirellulales bacterium]|nr:GGDEF domain-containing protein [Pirellulales bacterium]
MSQSTQPHVGNLNHAASLAWDIKRSLVQIHPLDLHGKPIPLVSEKIVLGRGAGCDVRILDDSVSRRHVELLFSGRGNYLLDLESTNGVLVNGEPAKRCPLVSGDQIQIGTHVFRFLADEDLDKVYQETVYAMLTRDGLTGAYNKRYFTETLDREVARCKRHGRRIAVILLDVDGLASLNGQYGRVVGDQILRQLGGRMRGVLRREDVLARYSGHEFAVLIVESQLEDIIAIAQRCLLAINERPIETTVGQVEVTVSVGVAAPDNLSLGCAEELVAEAKELVDEAKRGGRNRVIC